MCSGARTGSARIRSHRLPGTAARGSVVSVTAHRIYPRPCVVLSADMDRKWWTLVAVCTATFMLLLDITIVNVALPSIERDLGADLTDLQWVIDAYALTLAALLLTGGSLADRVGRRLVFVIGLVIFTVASVLCGLAGTPLTLNLARALQGIGGAFMFATSLALLASAYSGRDRGTAFGLWGATTGAAVAIGPLVGGVLTEGDRLGGDLLRQRADRDRARSRSRSPRSRSPRIPTPAGLDCARAPCCSPAPCSLLIFGLIRGNAEGWGSPLIVARAGRRGRAAGRLRGRRAPQRAPDARPHAVPQGRRSSAPPSPRSCCRRRCSRCSSTSRSTSRTSSATRALESGVRFMPVTLLSFVVAPICGKLAERLGVRWFIAGGLALVGAGLLLMGGLEAGDDWTALLAGFMVAGGGIGLVNPALATAAVGVVDPRRAGHGLRHQLDLPPGRHRHRHRRLGRDLPARRARRVRARRARAPACAAPSSAAATWPTSSPSAAPAAAATRSSRGSASRRSSPASTTCCCSRACSRFVGAVLCARADPPRRLRRRGRARRPGSRAASASV